MTKEVKEKIKLVKAYKPNGEEVEVNEHAAACIARGDKSVKDWSLEKPKAK